MDFSSVVTQEDVPEGDGDLTSLTGGIEGSSPKTMPPIWSEVSHVYVYIYDIRPWSLSLTCKWCLTICIFQVMRFFTNPHKPMILALSRPDPKKNITTLLKAFGECRPLKELANLVSRFNTTGLSVWWKL